MPIFVCFFNVLGSLAPDVHRTYTAFRFLAGNLLPAFCFLWNWSPPNLHRRPQQAGYVPAAEAPFCLQGGLLFALRVRPRCPQGSTCLPSRISAFGKRVQSKGKTNTFSRFCGILKKVPSRNLHPPSRRQKNALKGSAPLPSAGLHRALKVLRACPSGNTIPALPTIFCYSAAI